MKKNKLNIILSILLVVFTISIVSPKIPNDTFFTIAIGNDVMKNGISMYDTLTWHQNLKFEHSGEFDILIASIYHFANFTGIYIFAIFISCLIALVLFYSIISKKINGLIAFFTTLLTMFFAKDFLTPRAHLISYFMFVLEIYGIEKLLESGKKRYGIGLFAISVIIANLHSSVWPMFFVLFLPYIAEYIFKIITKSTFEKKSIIILLITMLMSAFSGFCTPALGAPYRDMINVVKGISKDFIIELKPVAPVQYYGMIVMMGIYILILLFMDKSKVKISDVFMAGGLFFMALLAARNMGFFFFLGAIPLARFLSILKIEDFDKLDNITQNLEEKKIHLFGLCGVIVILSIINYWNHASYEYVNENTYPVYASEYILNNLDVNTMRIFNHFDFGAYLEFRGIPAFIDSRSGMFCKEFNDTTILEDWLNSAFYGTVDYQKIFDKYEITHVLLYKNEIINSYIGRDQNYKKIYEDINFVLYEKI